MLERLRAELLALVVPPVCAACRAPLPRAGDPLCGSCRRALPWLRGPRCQRCALPAPCTPCPARAAAFERAWAPLAYEGPARVLVGALKFRGALALADLMAAQIVAGAPPLLLASATLVPVPLHPARRRARGFDQAEQLARALAKRTDRPALACLRRRGAPTRQVGAGRDQRLQTGRIDLELAAPAPAIVLLVDDVHTTGATLDSCARILRAAGARRVACITYARTLHPGG
jgi:ComF family protein